LGGFKKPIRWRKAKSWAENDDGGRGEHKEGKKGRKGGMQKNVNAKVTTKLNGIV